MHTMCYIIRYSGILYTVYCAVLYYRMRYCTALYCMISRGQQRASHCVQHKV